MKAPSITDLCATCHDGTGSKYDEVRGLVRTGPAWNSAAYAAAGPFGDALKFGSGVETSSVHSVARAVTCPEGGNPATCGTEWELNADKMARLWMAPGSGWTREAGPKDTNDEGNRVYRFVTAAWSSWLYCSSCHEPHDRGKNFRLLRPVINDRPNILVRGVSEVVPGGEDFHPHRGIWEKRAMYTKFLSGGNSVLVFYTPRVEDPGELSGQDVDPPNGIDDGAERACLEEKGEIELDPSSPSGYRCLVKRGMGGVTSFCAACHRTFMWPEAWVARDSFPDPYDPGSGKTYSGMDQAETSPGSFVPPGASLDQSWGQHKHPIAIKPMEAALEGRLVEGTLAEDGDICSFRKLSSGDPRCRDVDQWRVRDPVVPLEGKERGADTVVSLDPRLGLGEATGGLQKLRPQRHLPSSPPAESRDQLPGDPGRPLPAGNPPLGTVLVGKPAKPGLQCAGPFQPHGLGLLPLPQCARLCPSPDPGIRGRVKSGLRPNFRGRIARAGFFSEHYPAQA